MSRPKQTNCLDIVHARAVGSNTSKAHDASLEGLLAELVVFFYFILSPCFVLREIIENSF